MIMSRDVGPRDGERRAPTAEQACDELGHAATGLVNPASGIANDFLNHFNEVLLLIENLPVLLPEMVDELLQWRPMSYREYFRTSTLPDSARALQIYDTIDDRLRDLFELHVAQLHQLALDAIEAIKSYRGASGEIRAEDVAEFCELASLEIRRALERTADLVNHGYALPSETPQSMADRLLASTA